MIPYILNDDLRINDKVNGMSVINGNSFNRLNTYNLPIYDNKISYCGDDQIYGGYANMGPSDYIQFYTYYERNIIPQYGR